MALNPNVFTNDDTERRFKFVPSSGIGHQSWEKLSRSTRMNRFAVRAKQVTETCVRGGGPFIEFRLIGIRTSAVASSGILNVDYYIRNNLGRWRELDELVGKIHPTYGGYWEIDRDTRTVAIRNACLAFTHRKKNCEPGLRELDRPVPWGLSTIVVKNDKIFLIP